MSTIKFRSTFVALGWEDYRINVVSVDEFLAISLATNDEDVNFVFGTMEFAAELSNFCKGKWITLTHYIKLAREVDELTLDDLEHP